VQLEGLGKLRHCNLPACGIVPQQDVLPHAPVDIEIVIKMLEESRVCKLDSLAICGQ
jgi:hypothetical protein